MDVVLVGSEMAERVRATFDAYIFMSYRKKDRAYAQELMRLIHKNENFRDIAILYDEYLVPGENFSNAIQKALQRCNLFSLVVTPSILEHFCGKPNYVMGNEFPAAKKSGKPIIPTEMDVTDKTRLEKEYPGIPPCISGSDMDELEIALSAHLKKEALRKSTLEHNFLIGLAYLDGIDVEVDSEKAVSLITAAAEANVKEAMRKLVSMYRDGKGVTRNCQKSIEWQKKLIHLIKEGPNSDINVSNLLYKKYGILADLYDVCANRIMALSCYANQIEICQAKLKTSEAVDDIYRFCNTVNKTGFYLSGQPSYPDDMEDLMLKSIEYAGELFEKENEEKYRICYEHAFMNYANYYRDRCKYRESLVYYKHAIHLISSIKDVSAKFWGIPTK